MHAEKPGHAHAGGHASHAHGHDDHAHGGLGLYLSVFVALCVLTAISFAVGNSAALKAQSPTAVWATMMAVSCAKALLVILFFMHLKWEANWKYVLTVPASVMSLFLVLMLIPDIGRRSRHYADDRWLYAAEPTEVKAASPGAGHGAAGHGHEHGPGEKDHAEPKH